MAVKTEEPMSGCPICSRNLTFTYKVLNVVLMATMGPKITWGHKQLTISSLTHYYFTP